MKCKDAIIMPSNCVKMNEEEMAYIDGGLDYKKSYMFVSGAMAKAISYRKEMGWKNISTYDMAAEIFSHAYAYYNGKDFLAICKGLGFSTSAIESSDFWTSISNGIDLENGLDTNTIGGVERYVLYRAFYAAAVVV